MDKALPDRTLRAGLYFFAAACLLSITLSEAAILLMAAAVVWKTFASPEGFRRTASELNQNPLVFPLTVYLVSYVFSSIFSLDPHLSFSRLNTELMKVLAALTLFHAVSNGSRQKAVRWFLAGAAAAGLMGVWQLTSSLLRSSGTSLVRAYGAMHAVSYGEVMALAAVMAVLAATAARGRARGLLQALLACIFAGFCASLSRGPALGLILSLGVVFALIREARKTVLVLFSVLLLAFAATAVQNKASRERVTDIKKDYTVNVRFSMWHSGLRIFRDYPLTGTGPYALRRVFNYYHHQPVDNKIDFQDVHDLYLQHLAESGLPGLFALLLLLYALLRSSAKSFLEYRDVYSAWGLAALAGFLVMMITDSSFDLPLTAFLVYFIAAVSGKAGRPGGAGGDAPAGPSA